MSIISLFNEVIENVMLRLAISSLRISAHPDYTIDSDFAALSFTP